MVSTKLQSIPLGYEWFILVVENKAFCGVPGKGTSFCYHKHINNPSLPLLLELWVKERERNGGNIQIPDGFRSSEKQSNLMRAAPWLFLMD